MKSRLSLLALVAALTIAVEPAFAQTAPAAGAKPPADAKAPEAKKPEEKKPDEKKKDPKTAEYEKAIKDLPKYDGAFTLYVKKKDILLEIPESALNKNIYFQASFNTGGSTAAQFGLPINDIDVFQFRKFGDDRVHLVRPNTKFRWSDSSPWANASKNAFPEAIVAELRIEQTDPEAKRMLVNASSLFTGDLVRLGEMMQMALGSPFALDREKTGIDKIVADKDATSVRMAQHYIGARGGGGGGIFELLAMLGMGGNNLEESRSAPIKVTFTMYWPKDTGYQPRISDPRIGYFTTNFRDLDRKYVSDDQDTRYITRWNFGGKKNPSEKLSEPNRPMVWVIDSTVPAEYRDAAKQGILSWNGPLEKLGYKNAIQVIDAPADENYDHADGRFNVYRWTITNGFDGAIALFRSDPFTSEIRNASINFDASFVIFGTNEYDRDFIPAGRARQLARYMVNDCGTAAHDHAPISGTDAFNYMFKLKNPAEDLFRKAAAKFGWDQFGCSYGSEAGKRVSYDLAALDASAGGKIAKDEYIKQFVTNVTAHEMGHCLGLRHNFVASTNLAAADLTDDQLVRSQGVAASLMDYTPVNNQALLRGSGIFYDEGPGIYDYLAIEYGYRDIMASSPESELPQLKRLASNAAKRGLEFMSDEDADGPDPFVRRWDLGRDPVAYSASEFQIAKNLRRYALTKLPKPGESLDLRNRLLISSVTRTFRSAAALTPFIGGVQASRAFSTDPIGRNTLRPVDANLQRSAMQTILREALSMKSIDVPEAVLQSMNLSYETGAGHSNTMPLRSMISGQLIGLAGGLMSNGTAEMILENEFKTRSTAPYTLQEHYGQILAKVFEEVGTNVEIQPVRRDLQEFVVQALLDQAVNDNLSSDLRNIAATSVTRLRDRFNAAATARKQDDATRTHLRALADLIVRYQNRVRVEGNFGAGGGGGFDLNSLFGRP